MSEKNENVVKYCVHCGAQVEKGQVYCPNCGKLIVERKPSKEEIQQKKISGKPMSKGKIEISRKCSGCGSVITSTVLEQCPICNTLLEPIPKYQEFVRSSPGFIFTKKKLESERKLSIRKESWNFREGINVFISSFVYYILVQLLLIMFIWAQTGLNESYLLVTSELNIYTILLGQIPGIIFGIYPLYYIYSRKHNSVKLGFISDSKKFILAIFIGIIGGLLLLGINFLASFINLFFSNIGLALFDISASIEQQNIIIKEAHFIWIILLLVMVSLQVISVEIVFRGVLHNSLKEIFERDNKDIKGKFIVILIVALSYSLLYLLFSYLFGIVFFILNFLVFLLLGVLYEINGNIHNTIIASIFYNNLLIILIVFL